MSDAGQQLERAAAVVRPRTHGPRFVGRGRSGAVYRDQDACGGSVARKIFTGDRLSALLLYLLTGAANPYGWNRDALQSAILRRKILKVLVQYWFGGRLRVPRTFGGRWNRHFRAFELRAEFIRGRHLPLRYWPCERAPDVPDPLGELTGTIMKPLQARLIAAGLDGMVWQAGYGNPVAGGNFMIHEQEDGSRCWFWIDTESGVPALFPLNPWRLIQFYLPRSIRHRRLLFDDIDIPKLRRYIDRNAVGMVDKLGVDSVNRLRRLVARLQTHQEAWKELDRTSRGIACFERQGRISRRQARWYSRNRFRWQLRLAATGMQAASRQFVSGVKRVARYCRDLQVRASLQGAARFASSSRYRRFVSRRIVRRRIRGWRRRRFLTRLETAGLRAELHQDEAGLCITDFGVHVALKPLIKFLEWCVLPILFAVGVLNAPLLAVLMSTSGAIARTAYTLLRCANASVSGRRRPWMALFVGMIPFVGTVAYPVQLVAWSTTSDSRLARFLVYDTFASVGRAIPIWGGESSLLESWANRLPDYFLRAVPPKSAVSACRETVRFGIEELTQLAGRKS